MRFDSHGKPLVRYVAELELGMGMSGYGPTKGFRLIAATLDPATLKPENTWYLATTLPLDEASPGQVYELYRLRDWIEHYYKPAKHELGWADYQVRPERAIVRHWQLVMLAFTFSLLVGAVPTSALSRHRCAAVLCSPRDCGRGKNQHQPPAKPGRRRGPGSGSSGTPRCGGCAAGSAPGLGCRGTGNAGRAAPHRPNWPRSSPISLAPVLLTRPCPDLTNQRLGNTTCS